MPLTLDVIHSQDAIAQFQELTDHAFQAPAGMHYLQDFPVWDPAYGPGENELIRIGVFEGSTLVSCAAVRVAGLKARIPLPLRVGVLGAVATRSEWRGRGLASKTVAIALDWAKERGAAAVFLWGSEHSLYRGLGFELCGSQFLLPLGPTGTGEGAAGTVIHSGWDDRIFELLRRRKEGLDLRPGDLKWLRAHSSVSWLWAETGGQPCAYAAIGRGIDLQNIVHEWGGEGSALRLLLECVRSERPGVRILGSAEGLERLGFGLGTATPEPLCMAHVFDPGQVFQAYFPGTPVPAMLGGGLGPGELARLLFGAPGFELPPSSRQFFPLPLWIWGLDAS